MNMACPMFMCWAATLMSVSFSVNAAMAIDMSRAPRRLEESAKENPPDAGSPAVPRRLTGEDA